MDAAREVTLHRDVIVHPTNLQCEVADLSAPGAITEVYRTLVTDQARTLKIAADISSAVQRGRHCLVLTQWTEHVDNLEAALRDLDHDPVILRGGLSAKARREAMARMRMDRPERPLLAIATGSYLGEGFDCPALDTLFLAFPIVFKGRVVQYVGRTLRPSPGKTNVEVHDYVDIDVPVLVRAHSKRVTAYAGLGFPPPVRTG
jgi:superfamily II DNA or RNA helicase